MESLTVKRLDIMQTVELNFSITENKAFEPVNIDFNYFVTKMKKQTMVNN